MVLKEPVGPVIGLAAWNFPASNVIRKVAGALGAGCSIILKPAEETPGTAIAIARCFQEAGLPPGALNVVFGVPSKASADGLGRFVKVVIHPECGVRRRYENWRRDAVDIEIADLDRFTPPALVSEDNDVSQGLSTSEQAPWQLDYTHDTEAFKQGLSDGE